MRFAIHMGTASAIQPDTGVKISAPTASGRFVRPICAGLRLYGGAEKIDTESTPIIRSQQKNEA